MLEFLKKLFRMIFGGGNQATQTETTAPTQESTGKDQAAKENKPAGKGTMTLELKRSSYGKHDTLGKFFINGEFAAYSMESPKPDCLEAGTYSLSLRKEGGKHATYWYKFGDQHKGMLFLESGQDAIYPYICIGNTGADAMGSILLGTETKDAEQEEAERQVWYSENAYIKVYQQIAEKLEAGEELEISLS